MVLDWEDGAPILKLILYKTNGKGGLVDSDEGLEEHVGLAEICKSLEEGRTCRNYEGQPATGYGSENDTGMVNGNGLFEKEKFCFTSQISRNMHSSGCHIKVRKMVVLDPFSLFQAIFLSHEL